MAGKRAALFGGLVLAAAAAFGCQPAHAAGPTFGQKILPLDCIFETVADGTGTLRYLTPAECGVLIPTPVTPAGPVAAGSEGVVSPQNTAVQPETGSAAPDSRVAVPPDWRPLAQVKGAADKKSTVKGDRSTTGIVVLALLAVLLLIGAFVL